MSSRGRYRILVCRGPECGDKRGSAAVFRELQRQLLDCPAAVELGWQSCFGRCTQGPNVLVRELASEGPVERAPVLAMPPRGAGGRTALYNGVSVARVGEIVQGHLVGGRVQRQLIERPAGHLLEDPE